MQGRIIVLHHPPYVTEKTKWNQGQTLAIQEQKIAKLIELIEELRKDLPDINDRDDWEAKIMQKAADPQVVLDILKDNLESTEV